MMSRKDLEILDRCHEEALKEMGRTAVAIADSFSNGEVPPKQMLDDYRKAKLAVESTRRDIEYCITLELAEIMNK